MNTITNTLLAATLVTIRLIFSDGTFQDVPVASTTTTTTVSTTTQPPTTTLPPTALPLVAPFLGLVHENACDTALAQPGFQQGWWSRQCGGACVIGGAPYSCRQYELPLVFTSPAWNAAPSTIMATMQSFYQENPSIPIWQFGWEENIKGGCCSGAQLATIDQELTAVKQARANAGNSSKIAYQLVWQTGNTYNGTGTDIFNGSASSVRDFFAPSSPAPRNLDYVALHPYLWNNWPNPDVWVPAMVGQLKSWITSSANPRVEIIFTEGGATVCDTSTSGCSCDEYGTTVRAMGQGEHADYWLKAHVLALANGVKKVIWYSGATDGTCGPGSSCEATCFGITNNAGGRQTRTAYSTLTHCIGDKTSVTKLPLAAPLQSYDFAGPSGHCFIAWTYQPGTTEVVRPTLPQASVSVATLTGGRVPVSITDKLGGVLSTSSVTLSPSPVFIRTN